MKKDLEIIKLTLQNFINTELVINNKSSVTVLDFMNNVEKYFNLNKVFFNKHKVRFYTCKFLGDKLNQSKYNSNVSSGQRVYFNFSWKNEVNKINNNIEIETLNLEPLYKQINTLKENIDDLTLKINALTLQIENRSKPVEKVKLSSFIVDSLNLSQEKDSTYTLSNFCLDFIEYSEDTKNILYSNTIIGDYKKYTNSMISDNTLSKILKKSLIEIYPDIESKSYNDKNYYKGFIYKNVSIK